MQAKSLAAAALLKLTPVAAAVLESLPVQNLDLTNLNNSRFGQVAEKMAALKVGLSIQLLPRNNLT